jgi:DNA-binding transcriptional LysR family regulator
MPLRDPDKLASRLKLRHLNVLRAVARCGSIRKAAGELSLTQPAVSKTVAELEALVEVPLFDRTVQGVEPTAYGRALLRRAGVVLDELTQGMRDLSFLADPSRGELRVGASEGVAAGLLPAAVSLMLERHPGVSIHVVNAESMFAYLRELRERTIELAVGRVPEGLTEPDIEATPIAAEPLVVACGLQHPMARRRKVALADLADQRWILPPPGTAMAALVGRLFERARVPQPHASVVTMSIAMRLHLMSTGRFVTTLPQSMLRHSPLRKEFKVLPVAVPGDPGQVAVVRLKDRTLSPVAERFVQVLIETADAH